MIWFNIKSLPVSYTHLRAHETVLDLVCRLLLEKKGKTEKAKKRYEKALSYLIKSNEKKPNQPDTLNYLGFALRKLGEFKEAEKYYLQGLNIKPDHNGINEYLGELYIQTNRLDLAKGRLEVLKNCKCEEYEELKELIENN